MRLLIAGATGLVGGQAVRLALADDRFAHVVAPTRRPLMAHFKLTNPVVDFDRLPAAADWWTVDAAIGALGTTRAAAGSAAGFRVVDHDYALAVARLVRDHGATCFALVSAKGADARSTFLYPRTKGEVERAVRALGFASLTIVRPGLLGGDRAAFRAAERVAGIVLRAAGPLLPRGWRISPAATVARVLLDAALAGTPGTHIIEADQLVAG